MGNYASTDHVHPNYQVAGDYAVKNDLKNYLTKTETENQYQQKGNYALKNDLRSYITKTESDNQYQPKGKYAEAADIVKLNESLNNFQPKGNYAVSEDILNLNESLKAFQPKGNYAVAADIVKLNEALKGYQPKGDYAAATDITKLNETLNGFQPKGNYILKNEIGTYVSEKNINDIRQNIIWCADGICRIPGNIGEGGFRQVKDPKSDNYIHAIGFGKKFMNFKLPDDSNTPMTELPDFPMIMGTELPKPMLMLGSSFKGPRESNTIIIDDRGTNIYGDALIHNKLCFGGGQFCFEVDRGRLVLKSGDTEIGVLGRSPDMETPQNANMGFPASISNGERVMPPPPQQAQLISSDSVKARVLPNPVQWETQITGKYAIRFDYKINLEDFYEYVLNSYPEKVNFLLRRNKRGVIYMYRNPEINPASELLNLLKTIPDSREKLIFLERSGIMVKTDPFYLGNIYQFMDINQKKEFFNLFRVEEGLLLQSIFKEKGLDLPV